MTSSADSSSPRKFAMIPLSMACRVYIYIIVGKTKYVGKGHESQRQAELWRICNIRSGLCTPVVTMDSFCFIYLTYVP
ncbi:hypothetical protein F4781DRAFT_383795, partial [Annulohypoxylon bovei var. microspora]